MNLINHNITPISGVAESPATGAALPDGCILVEPEHPLRVRVEAFIAQRFFNTHGARISSFMPLLIAVCEGGEIRAVAGLRDAGAESLFLEHYLDVPVEQAIADGTVGGSAAKRDGIVEIGNLASIDRRSSLKLYTYLASYLVAKGYHWAVFTGCSSLQRMFTALGIETIHLGRALQSRLPADQQTWGSYYEDNPTVVAGQVSRGYRVFKASDVLADARLAS
jgi:hypothetical protein